VFGSTYGLGSEEEIAAGRVLSNQHLLSPDCAPATNQSSPTAEGKVAETARICALVFNVIAIAPCSLSGRRLTAPVGGTPRVAF
jgi:hypothetical protein